MTVTITLVGQHHDRLRYLCVADGDSIGTITCTGAASPDLKTDSLFGPIKPMTKVVAAGYGTDVGGAQNQAQSRAIFANDSTGANIGNANIQRAQPTLTARAGIGIWRVDADTDGTNPEYLVTFQGGEVSSGEAYLDVYVPGTIGA